MGGDEKEGGCGGPLDDPEGDLEGAGKDGLVVWGEGRDVAPLGSWDGMSGMTHRRLLTGPTRSRSDRSWLSMRPPDSPAQSSNGRAE